jgi:NADH dehydrogenase FAD-containing subunit
MSPSSIARPTFSGTTSDPNLRAELHSQLSQLGVDLVIGEELRNFPPTAPTELNAFSVTTNTDRHITADIWFQCFGMNPTSVYLSGDLATARRDDGFVRVGRSLQVQGHEHLFAIGDVATADVKMASAGARQANLTANNVRKLINGDHALMPYTPAGASIAVTIGPDGGSGQRADRHELGTRDAVANSKGRDILIDRYATLLGLSISPEDLHWEQPSRLAVR